MSESTLELIEKFSSEFEKSGLVFGHGTDNAFDDALFLALNALGWDYNDTSYDRLRENLSRREQDKVKYALNRRLSERIPAAYIAKKMWFAGTEYLIDSRVLVPRSPIATLIHNRFKPWLKKGEPKHILDIGTGSGCIGIACALAFPEAKVDGVDISREALAVAQINAVRQNVTGRVNFIEADVFPVGGIYDLIVSNPPYVPDDVVSGLPDEYTAEPKIALAGGAEGLDILDKILNGARRYLRADGILVVEVGGSRELVEKRYPHLELMWIESEDALAGVFVVDRVSLPSVR